jgi:hypothetical protein
MLEISCRKQGFNFEFGKAGTVLEKNPSIEELDKDIKFYNDYFVGRSKISPLLFKLEEHFTTIGMDINGKGPVCISILPTSRTIRVILRTKKVPFKIYINPFQKGDIRNSIRKYSNIDIPNAVYLGQVLSVAKLEVNEWLEVDEPKLLLEYEAKTCTDPRYKFGVIYIKKGQDNEDEIFQNRNVKPFIAYLCRKQQRV